MRRRVQPKKKELNASSATLVPVEIQVSPKYGSRRVHPRVNVSHRLLKISHSSMNRLHHV